MGMAWTPVQSSADEELQAPLLPQPPVVERRWHAMVSAATTVAIVASALVLLLMLQVYDGEVTSFIKAAMLRRAEGDVVASENVLCSDIGVDILKNGGNAIDSAIATAFCEGISSHGSSGIVGGDFMLVRLADGHTEAFDFKPRKSQYANGNDAKRAGGISIGVPGEVKGLYKVWTKYGTLPWRSLMEPGIHLANEGFPISPDLAAQIQSSVSSILANPGLRNVLVRNGVPLFEEEILFRERLAETLMAISERGPHEFHSWPVLQDADGILAVQDLSDCRQGVSEPLVAEGGEHTGLIFVRARMSFSSQYDRFFD